jgi:DNA-binding GntR family transcriptional regulator
MADSSLSSRVYDDILGRILGGQMRPGDLFNRRQVAAEMGVSVAPVLEAMLELESEGLIETLPRRGTRVRLPSVQDAWGQAIVREALECQAARLYAGESIRRHRTRLTRLAEDLDRLESGSVSQIREEIRFHHYLVSLAQCPALTQEFERVAKIGLIHATVPAAAANGTDALLSHTALVELLLASDADSAEAAIRQHLRATTSQPQAETPAAESDALPPLPTWLGRD